MENISLPSKYTNETVHKTTVSITNQLGYVCDKLIELNTICRNLEEDVKAIHKNYNREKLRIMKKKPPKKNTKVHLPMKITPILRKFLGLEKGELISKRDAMARISTYVKENNLQIEENKRLFTPDEVLIRLFKLNKSKIYFLTFVEINKYISQHFIT